MHAVGTIFVKTYLKAIRDTIFSNMWNFPIVIFLSNRRGKSKLLGLQGDATSPKFSCLVGHSDLSMRKTLRLVGLLTVTIFFRSKKLTACKIKDEKDEIFFYFLVFNLLKIVHLFESKKHLRTQ